MTRSDQICEEAERELVDGHPVIMMQGRYARLGSQTIHYTVAALLSSYKFQPLLQPSPQLVIGRITVKPRLANNRTEMRIFLISFIFISQVFSFPRPQGLVWLGIIPS